MKKNFRFLAVLFAAIVVFGSCSREDQPNVNENIEGDYLVLNLATPETRSSLTPNDNNNGLTFAWSKDDVLHCMYVKENNGYPAEGTVQEGGATLKVEKPTELNDLTGATLYAYYNASVTNNSLSCSTDGKVTVNIDNAQFSSSSLENIASHQAMYGSVVLKGNATSDLTMHHIGSVMKITATEAIKGNVTLDNVGNNNFVAKKGTFNFTEETPKFTAAEAQSTITATFDGKSTSYVWFVPNAKGNGGVLAVTAENSSVALGNYGANLVAGKVYPINLTIDKESKEITAVNKMSNFVVNPALIPWCGDEDKTYSPLFSSGEFNGKFSTAIDVEKPLTIYFRGREEFKEGTATPHFYAWKGEGESKVEIDEGWPGRAMTRVDYLNDGDNGDKGLDYFVITLTKEEVGALVENNNLKLIFNNNNNGWQTDDLTLIPVPEGK